MTMIRTGFTARWSAPARLAGLVAIAATMGLATLPAAQAMKKLNESGSFDCSCKSGHGTCTFESSTDNTSCYKGPGDSCTGSCSLTLTPNGSGAAAMPGKKAVAGTMKTFNKAKKQ